MTVKELIEELKKFDSNLPVMFDYGSSYEHITKIEKEEVGKYLSPISVKQSYITTVLIK